MTTPEKIAAYRRLINAYAAEGHGDQRDAANFLLGRQTADFLDAAVRLRFLGLVGPTAACCRAALECVWLWRWCLSSPGNFERWMEKGEGQHHASMDRMLPYIAPEMMDAFHDARGEGPIMKDFQIRPYLLVRDDLVMQRSYDVYYVNLCTYVHPQAPAVSITQDMHEAVFRMFFAPLDYAVTEASAIFQGWRESRTLPPVTAP